MAWFVLLVSAVLEAVWAVALGQSDGLSRPAPTLVFLVALVVSMIGLARAARDLPIGTAYAVWVGIGAVLTVGYGMATGTEEVSWAKLVFIAGILLAVIGLKLLLQVAPPGRKQTHRPGRVPRPQPALAIPAPDQPSLSSRLRARFVHTPHRGDRFDQHPGYRHGRCAGTRTSPGAEVCEDGAGICTCGAAAAR